MKIPVLCLYELSSNEWRDQRASPYAVDHGIVKFREGEQGSAHHMKHVRVPSLPGSASSR